MTTKLIIENEEGPYEVHVRVFDAAENGERRESLDHGTVVVPPGARHEVTMWSNRMIEVTEGPEVVDHA